MKKIFESITGPTPYRVYQRSENNTASIDLSGTLAAGGQGTVEVRLTKSGKQVDGYNWATIQLQDSTFGGVLKDVPVGGPYVVELQVKDGAKIIATRKIPGQLVGDLWILAGQSNMDGYGKLVNLESPSQSVNCFYYGDYWGVAKDPLCWLNESIDPVHWQIVDPDERLASVKADKISRQNGAGLGVRFGKDLFKATGVPVGLLMCSHGGTSLDQWSPSLKDRGGDSLYGCMIRRIGEAGGRVAGCLWYQGESDTANSSGGYKEQFRNLIESLRSDVNQPELPFIYVQLAGYFADDSLKDGWNRVQNDQLLLEREMDNVAFAAAIDSSFSDAIHLDAVSGRRMGARLAKLAAILAFGSDGKLGPRPANAVFTDRKTIVVSFDSVNGVLLPVRDIRGFHVEKDGKPVVITRCVRGSDGASVVITLSEPAPSDSKLWYGRGLNPVCNLSDKAGLAAPVFGPMDLGP